LINFLRWFFTGKDAKAQNTRRIVKIAILLGLFVALFWIVPVEKVVQALLTVDLVDFLIALALGLGVILFTSLEMKPLASNQGIRRSLWQIISINLAVKFYLLFTPTTLIASGIRWYRFSQPEGKVAEAFVALAFFRLFETFMTLTMGLGFLMLSQQQALRVSAGWVALIIFAIIVVWVVITRYSLPVYLRVKQRTGLRFRRPIWQSILVKFEKLLEATSAYARMPAVDLLIVVGSGIASALTAFASGMFLAKSLGMEISFFQMGWILAIVSLTAQLPFTMAEGLGVREVTMVALLALIGISAEQALALSFLIFIRGVLIALLGGVLEAIDTLRHRRMGRLETINKNEL
jgi:uncharacterized membrane protein YbhN (UPF0104 family)